MQEPAGAARLDREDGREASLRARVIMAVPLGLAGFGAYLSVVLVLADRVAPFGSLAQVGYFLAAGVAWVLPAHFLMLWAGGK